MARLIAIDKIRMTMRCDDCDKATVHEASAREGSTRIVFQCTQCKKTTKGMR